MGLLKPKSQRKRGPVRQSGVIRCPANGHQAGACRQLCTPIEGLGLCGRDAPQGLVGRTQLAIRSYGIARRSSTSRKPERPR